MADSGRWELQTAAEETEAGSPGHYLDHKETRVLWGLFSSRHHREHTEPAPGATRRQVTALSVETGSPATALPLAPPSAPALPAPEPQAELGVRRFAAARAIAGPAMTAASYRALPAAEELERPRGRGWYQPRTQTAEQINAEVQHAAWVRSQVLKHKPQSGPPAQRELADPARRALPAARSQPPLSIQAPGKLLAG